MTEERKRVVGEAIERWYTANYPRGVRLTFQQRAALAESINYRLDLVDTAEVMRKLDEHVTARGGS